jgi:2-polyprenyl-6-hydroxyphenyl methylase/3-demethylubiquinone-9 3-methyltransferase
MWLAINNAISKVSDDGQLFIAIYNDQGWKSRVWWLIKYFYNILPQPLDKFFAYSLGLGMNVLNLLKHALKGDHMKVIKSWLNYDKQRGMSFWHDVVDWYGGFPFEFASYELLHRYFQSSGFILERGEIATSLGCHQMVFKKTNDGL